MTADSDELDYTSDPDIMAAIKGGRDEQAEEDAAAGHSPEAEDSAPVDQTADEAPEAPESPDLSFLDDAFQEKLRASLPPEALAVLAKDGKDYLLRQQDYTRKTQSLAEQRREAEALREAAEQWQRLQSDPQAIDLVLNYWKNGGQAGRPAAEEEDPTEWMLDPAKWKEREERIIAEAEARAEARVLQKIQGPQEHSMALAKAAEGWMQANGKDVKVVSEAVSQIISSHGGHDATTPELIQSLLPDYVELIEARELRAAQEATRQTNSRKVAQARAASPRGGSSAGPTPDISLPDAVAAFEKKHGRKPAGEEFADLVFEVRAAARGKSARDYDKEWGRT